MRIYVTHCSGKKSLSAKRSGAKVTPDKLYTSKRIQPFMRRCKDQKVKWAIFSDLYGIWFPHEKKKWYEKSPQKIKIGSEEFKSLVRTFNRRLNRFGKISFYYHPARFHKLYRAILRETKLKSRVEKFKHIDEIV
jgi:hypothetical protein